MTIPILSSEIRFAHDVVTCRQQARSLAAELGFEAQDQTRIATAVSEIARNAFRYATKGVITYSIEENAKGQSFVTVVEDKGEGIADIDLVLSGRYRSDTGMGMGLLGTRRLMDSFEIESSATGTIVKFAKVLPRHRRIDETKIRQITERIRAEKPNDPLAEVQQQNQELIIALSALREKQEELARLNKELEDTNRGVVALYAELDEKADHLRRADELKSKFLSNMSHEFRTPLNSILALSRILLDRTDGPLTPEQDKQVTYVRKAASDLSELVNDLLDLAKVEAGKIVVHPVEFSVDNLFGALRGMLRPLLISDTVNLVFDDVSDLPPIFTDEGKVSQILRNLISNALKFTEQGEVQVKARLDRDAKQVIFEVSDTGIGIADGDREAIFEEFTMLDSAAQRRVKGTGLGLPLSRKLAELLGGSLTVESVPGKGSTFIASLPALFEVDEPAAPTRARPVLAEGQIPIVIVEDRELEMHIYEKYFQGSRFQVIPAFTIKEARMALKTFTPKVLILDILLKGEDGWRLLKEVKNADGSPFVVVLTNVEDRGRAMALGADLYLAKPVDGPELRRSIEGLLSSSKASLALVIDDEEISRYIIQQLLEELNFNYLAASGGREGLELASKHHPDIIILDLGMPDMDGFEVARRLAENENTVGIPILIYSSKVLTEEEQAQLAPYVSGRIMKDIVTKEDALRTLHDELQRLGLESTLVS